MSDSEKYKFHFEEYRVLREEVLVRISQLDRIIYFTAFAFFVLATWLMSEETDFLWVFHLSPLWVALVGTGLFYSKLKFLNRMTDYIKLLEEKLSDTDIEGWDHYRRGNNRAASSISKLNCFCWTSMILFGVMFFSRG